MYFFRSSADIRLPTSSSGVFGFPLPAIEWHIEHLWAVYTCCPRSVAGFDPSSARADARPSPTASAVPATRLRLIRRPSLPTATISLRSAPHQPGRDRLADAQRQLLEAPGEVVG